MRAQITCCAFENKNRLESRKYNIPESTMRGFVKNYKVQRKFGKDVSNIPRTKCGGYKILPKELNEKLIGLVKALLRV